MSSVRRFRSNAVQGGDNVFWQKRTGDNFTIELIPETGVNSVFIKKDLQVANEITVTSSEKNKEHIKDIEMDVDDILKLITYCCILCVTLPRLLQVLSQLI